MFSLICTLIKQLSKQSWGWWFETSSRSLWRHCNAMATHQVGLVIYWQHQGKLRASSNTILIVKPYGGECLHKISRCKTNITRGWTLFNPFSMSQKKEMAKSLARRSVGKIIDYEINVSDMTWLNFVNVSSSNGSRIGAKPKLNSYWPRTRTSQNFRIKTLAFTTTIFQRLRHFCQSIL